MREVGANPDYSESNSSDRCRDGVLLGSNEGEEPFGGGEKKTLYLLGRTRAGFPATVVLDATSRVTTLPAPMTQFSPMVIPGKRMALPPIHELRPMRTGWATQTPRLGVERPMDGPLCIHEPRDRT